LLRERRSSEKKTTERRYNVSGAKMNVE